MVASVFYYGMFVEEWEAVSIRVARVVVETDAYLAGSYPTTTSAQGVRQGDTTGPFMLSQRLRDISSAVGPDGLIMPYFDGICTLSPD
jgi:hypothetical protein